MANSNVVKGLVWVVLVILILSILGTTPLWATGVSIEAVPDYAEEHHSFTARTETYFGAAGLSSPFDITLNKPSGTTDGDILFCSIVGYTTVVVDSVPSGWILLASDTGSGTKFYLYYKIASSEPASWTWSFTGSIIVRAACSCYTDGDFDPADPIDVISNTSYKIFNTQVCAASMTVSAANSPLVFFGLVYYDLTGIPTFTKPSVPTTDWVEDDDAGSNDMAIEICSMIWSGSGATGLMTATMTGSSNKKHGFVVALNPPPPAAPTVVTDNETSVSYTWGNVCANITDIGTASVTTRGFEWDTDSGSPYTWSWNETGSFSEGEFCHNITELGCNETYYFRGFAANAVGTDYGDEESFTTSVCTAATVATYNATGISYTYANLNGNITAIIDENCFTRGFKWDTDSGTPYTNDWHEDGDFGEGGFSYNVTTLNASQQYYFVAYAVNHAGISYGDELDFTTLAYTPPTVVTHNATDISWTDATLNGEITDVDGINATERGFEWDLDSGEPYANNWTEAGNFTVGTFSHNITDIPVDTIVFFRAIAYNGGGWGYGGEGNFTTLLCLPLAPTNFTATQIGVSSITLNWTKGLYATYTVIIVSEERQPTDLDDGYLTYNGTSNSTDMDGLNLGGSTYYYSAWSYNSAGYSVDYAETNIGGALMSMSMLLIGIIGLGAILTYFQFKNRSLPLTLASAAVWLAVFLWLFLGEVPGFDTTTLWGQVIPFVFILLTFVPILTFIGRMGKKEITASSKQGSYTEWSKPENIKLSRSQSVKDAHRARIRGVIDKHRVR